MEAFFLLLLYQVSCTVFSVCVVFCVSSSTLGEKYTEIKYMSIYVHLMITQYLIDLCKYSCSSTWLVKLVKQLMLLTVYMRYRKRLKIWKDMVNFIHTTKSWHFTHLQISSISLNSDISPTYNFNYIHISCVNYLDSLL